MAYYHVKVELKNKKVLYDLDNTKSDLIQRIIEPYREGKEYYLKGGTAVDKSKIDRIRVYSTAEIMKSKLPYTQYYERLLTRMGSDSYEETYLEHDIAEVRNRIRQMRSRRSFQESSILEDNKNFLDELNQVRIVRNEVSKIIKDLISKVQHRIATIEDKLQHNDVTESIMNTSVSSLTSMGSIFSRGPPPPLENDLCSVIIPFGKKDQVDGSVIDFDSIYKDFIKPSLENAGFRVMIARDIVGPSRPVIQDIWELIHRSRLLVADVTGKNPNVFYELGVAHTVSREVMIITQNKEDVPFDVGHLRYFLYMNNKKGKGILKRYLQEVAKDIRKKDPGND
jgi:hypothetical protein